MGVEALDFEWAWAIFLTALGELVTYLIIRKR
jgi:hypothetical protein